MRDVLSLPPCPVCGGLTVAATVGTGESKRDAVARCTRFQRGCDGQVPLGFETWEAHIRPRDPLGALADSLITGGAG